MGKSVVFKCTNVLCLRNDVEIVFTLFQDDLEKVEIPQGQVPEAYATGLAGGSVHCSQCGTVYTMERAEAPILTVPMVLREQGKSMSHSTRVRRMNEKERDAENKAAQEKADAEHAAKGGDQGWSAFDDYIKRARMNRGKRPW